MASKNYDGLPYPVSIGGHDFWLTVFSSSGKPDFFAGYGTDSLDNVIVRAEGTTGTSVHNQLCQSLRRYVRHNR